MSKRLRAELDETWERLAAARSELAAVHSMLTRDGVPGDEDTPIAERIQYAINQRKVARASAVENAKEAERAWTRVRLLEGRIDRVRKELG